MIWVRFPHPLSSPLTARYGCVIQQGKEGKATGGTAGSARTFQDIHEPNLK